MEEIKERRSIRKYKNKTIERDKIIQLLESARTAPSGDNTQPWNFILVQSEDMKKKVSKACHNQQWMNTASLLIVCVGDLNSRIKGTDTLTIDEHSSEEEVKQIIRDTAIAAEHIVLQAENLGLGTCWIAWFKQNDIRPVLNVPEDKYVISVITVGYADETPAPRPRRKLEDMVHYEKW
ncbi:FMN reductase [Clostridium luticellarii]|jgi:nitroreductase|uniref:FMN reductase n=2 Tax=Clostridium luticellarii TaxID=1691940 RepID=A0A2T0B2S6_9CLOT|nr:FMN reductase [Clostridium luticellarii]